MTLALFIKGTTEWKRPKIKDPTKVGPIEVYIASYASDVEASDQSGHDIIVRLLGLAAEVLALG